MAKVYYDRECDMSSEIGTGEKALFFVMGAFIGAATALLLAPGAARKQGSTSQAKRARGPTISRSRAVSSPRLPTPTWRRARDTWSSSAIR